jgi:spore cortex biosynthesis protein YabQ
MVYLPSMAEQTEVFIYSLGLGFLLGVFYDVFRTIRLAISSAKKIIFVQDVLYVLVCAIVSFLFFMVVNNGNIRAYAMLGELLGWIIYYFSFGVFAIRASATIIKYIKKLFWLIYRIVTTPFIWIYRLFRKPMVYFYKKTRKNSKLLIKNSKLHLKIRHGILYNLRESIGIKKSRKKED